MSAESEAETMEKLLTIKEAAEICAVSYGAIYDAIREKRLQASRIGRSYRIEPRVLQNFLFANRTDRKEAKR